MKEKIYKYLKEKDSKISTREIIKDFFHTNDNYSFQMEKVVDNLLLPDDRFVKDEQGKWEVTEISTDFDLNKMNYTIIDFEYIAFNKINIPIVVGCYYVEKSKIISKNIYKIEPRVDLTKTLQKEVLNYLEQSEISSKFEDDIHTQWKAINNSDIILVFSRKIEREFTRLMKYHLGMEFEKQFLVCKHILPKLLPDIKTKCLNDVADYFELAYQMPLNIENTLDVLHEIMSLLIESLHNKNINRLNELNTFIHENENLVDFSEYNFDRDYLSNLPESPGVYLMKDKYNEVIYVGKSKNLKSRVRSYFLQSLVIDDKTKLIHDKIFDIVYEETGSELEALLLEHRYIHQFRPNINKQFSIHKIDQKTNHRKKIVILAPSVIQGHVCFYFINGSSNAFLLEVNRENPDWQLIESRFEILFGNKVSNTSDFDDTQIEIIWRWFSFNKENMNYIDIEQTSGMENSLQILDRYLRDPNLFMEKSIYL